jgi:hypothetical protein
MKTIEQLYKDIKSKDECLSVFIEQPKLFNEIADMMDENPTDELIEKMVIGYTWNGRLDKDMKEKKISESMRMNVISDLSIDLCYYVKEVHSIHMSDTKCVIQTDAISVCFDENSEFCNVCWDDLKELEEVKK